MVLNGLTDRLPVESPSGSGDLGSHRDFAATSVVRLPPQRHPHYKLQKLPSPQTTVPPWVQNIGDIRSNSPNTQLLSLQDSFRLYILYFIVCQ